MNRFHVVADWPDAPLDRPFRLIVSNDNGTSISVAMSGDELCRLAQAIAKVLTDRAYGNKGEAS